MNASVVDPLHFIWEDPDPLHETDPDTDPGTKISR